MSDNSQNDGLGERAREVFTDVWDSLRPGFRYLTTRSLLAATLMTGIVGATVSCSPDKPHNSAPPVQPVADAKDEPFPSYHNPPSYAQLDEHCGKPMNHNGPMGLAVLPDSSLAIVTVNAWRHCDNPSGLATREQAAAEIGLTPQQLDRAAAVVGALDSGRGHAGRRGLPIDDRSGPDVMVPLPPLTAEPAHHIGPKPIQPNQPDQPK